MQLEKYEGGKKYITVLADGKFHQVVPEGTEGAVKREIKDKQTGEVISIKNELVFDSVTGKITKLSFEDSEYGKSIQVELDGEGILSLGTATNFGEDLMKKLPAIDFSKSVKIVPFSFEAEGKTKRGTTVYQDEQKIDSFYWDKEAKANANGIPEVEGDSKKFDADDWKMHFMKVRKFLVAQVEKLPIFSTKEKGQNNLEQM